MKKLLLSLSCITISAGATTSLISCKMHSSEVQVLFNKDLKPEQFQLGNSKNIATIALNQLFQLFVYTGKGKESLNNFMGEDSIKKNSFYKMNGKAKEFIEFISKPNKYSFKISLKNEKNKHQPLDINKFKPIEVTRKKINNSKDKFEIDWKNAKVSKKTLDEMKENNNLAKQLIEKYKDQYFLNELVENFNINEISFDKEELPIKAISSEDYFNEVVKEIKEIPDLDDNKDKKDNLDKKIKSLEEKLYKEEDDFKKRLLYQKCAEELSKDFRSSNLYKIKQIEKEMNYIARFSIYEDKDGNKHEFGIDDLYCKKIDPLTMELQVFEKDNKLKTIEVKVPQIYIVFKPTFLKDKNSSGDEEKNLVFLQGQNYQFTEFISSKNIFKGLEIEIIYK